MHLLIALAVLVLVAPTAAQAQKSIKVGMPMPLSGPPALFGEPASKGAQMFVDEINAMLKLMYAVVILAADRWREIQVGEFEQRQLRAIRDGLNRAHANG